MSPDPVLSISDIERETGIRRDTLRVWEKRYGFPVPQRNQRYERCYTGEQLDHLRLVKQLLDRGVRASKLLVLSQAQLRNLAEQLPGLFNSGGVESDMAKELVQDLINGKRESVCRRLELLLEQLGVVAFIEQVVAPMNRVVGEAWFNGRIGIIDEHYYAEQLCILLHGTLRHINNINRPVRVLLTTLPGEQHGIGILMVACLLSWSGLGVMLLGTQTPTEEIVRGARDMNVAIVGISFSSHCNRRDSVAQLVRLRRQLPDMIRLWAGGEGVRDLPIVPDGVEIVNTIAAVLSAAEQAVQNPPIR